MKLSVSGGNSERTGSSCRRQDQRCRPVAGSSEPDQQPGQLVGLHDVLSPFPCSQRWDANTVTHVLGIRAFGTQLLCEQVMAVVCAASPTT